MFSQQNPPLTTTMVVPPTTAIPTFSGKSTDNPRQFLLRIKQYTHTINQWSHATLLRSISEFLKEEMPSNDIANSTILMLSRPIGLTFVRVF